MADERCEWLDKDTADRLLRGGPVGAVDDRVRAQAARLYAVLDGVARPGACHENDELPGEKAALEAFRLAREARSGTLGPVRLDAAVPSAAGSRWRRPVRFGLAAAVAGCTLSGVAVAAGAGFLPSPFGSGAPMPASSVSAAVTSSPLISEVPTGGAASTDPAAGTPDSDRTERPSRSPENDRQRDHGTQHRATGSGEPSDDGGGDRTAPGEDSHGAPGDVYRRLAEACRDYRAGAVDGERRHNLETEADGASKVGKFCDRVLSGQGAHDGAGNGSTFGSLAPSSSPSSLPSPSPSPSLPAVAPSSTGPGH